MKGSGTESLRRVFRRHLASFFRTAGPPRSGGKFRVLAAVSGGADSVCLLYLLAECSAAMGFLLAAVTVDHGIRPQSESAGDADFVEAFCASRLHGVPCFRVRIAPGRIASAASGRGMGLEEAAREFRYAAFASVARKWRADAVMTGHTASDQAETVLMRVLQGAGPSGCAGIPVRRGIFFRPMLSFSGGTVRDFLRAENIPWREDTSNADSRFLRNRIRKRLVPLLDREFPGWQKSVLCGAEKMAADARLLSDMHLPAWKPLPEPAPDPSGPGFSPAAAGTFGLFCNIKTYTALPPALRLRFLYKGLAKLGSAGRVPYRLLRSMVAGRESAFPCGFSVRGAGIALEAGRHSIFLRRDIVQNSKNGYLVWVWDACTLRFPFGVISVCRACPSGGLVVRAGKSVLAADPPFAVRSRMPGDTVTGRDGNRRSLKKLFGQWGVPAFLRDWLPVLETASGIRGVFGSVLGFPDFPDGA